MAASNKPAHLKKILVLRFSAMGDVALLVPVIASLVKARQDVEVTVVTRPAFSALFESLPRVKVFKADVDKKYRGFFGIRRLFRALIVQAPFNAIVDAHDHVRTIWLRALFRLFGNRVYVIDKGRKQKKAFVRKNNKIVRPLPHTVDRYLEVFQRAGFSFAMTPGPYVSSTEKAREAVASWLRTLDIQPAGTREFWVGIAPFAAHATKLWPIENYPSLLKGIASKTEVRFFLFGGGTREIEFLDELSKQVPGACHRVAGNLALDEELVLISFLNLMVTVDSANMHLATLVDTPLVSIWGGTHPDVGFGPYVYGADSLLQIDREELKCRPCSVYGKEFCLRGDFACLTRITPSMVSEKIIQKLNAED